MEGGTAKEDTVIATAHEIVRSLALDKSTADDMLRILTTFDPRFSSLNFNQDSAASSSDADCAVEDPCDADVDKSRVNIQSRLERAKGVIKSSNSGSQYEIFDYLQHVDDVISIVNSSEVESFPDLFDEAEVLLQEAMVRLEDEFRLTMIKNTLPLDASGINRSFNRLSLSFASDEEFDASSVVNAEERLSLDRENSGEVEQHNNNGLIRIEAVDELKEIADAMIQAGYSKELCQVYSSVRREILDECLSVIGVERISIDEVQRMEWEILDDKMRKWIHAVQVVAKVLLSGERVLCDQVFAESEEIREECFVESTKGCVMLLLNFGDAVAIQKRTSEKLFRILGMYEALQEVKPKLDELYAGYLGKNIILEAERIMEWLSDAALGTLVEFGNNVLHDNSKKTINGDLHPMVRYVMNYIKLLGDYSTSLEPLLEKDVSGSEGVSDSGENISKLGRRMQMLISYVESRLEEKSNSYEDVALRYVFLMNNLHYIVGKVKGSDLIKLLGENWVRKRRGQIRQYHNSYLRATCTKPLSFLKDEGLSGSGSGSGSSNSGSKLAIKERFKNFNLAFEELYKTQITWKVSDEQLKEELRLSTSEQILPAYRSFVGRYRGQLENSRHASKYIKYSAEDLEDCLMKLFEGPTLMSNQPRRKTSMS